MNNNRITIISPSDKRRKTRYNIIMFLLLAVIIVLSCVMGYSYFQNKHNNTVNNDVTTTTTVQAPTTTTTTTTTTQHINTSTKATNNYVYNFSLTDGKYKVVVCNGDYNSKIAYYKLYNKDVLLGESNNLNGIIIDKNKVDLTHKPILSIELDNKKYNVKYNSGC